ncbi:hypothetical protein [Nocardia salmonicida]|uniref:hypothetical protein n=1 Tax=Nocardia salmonicida TaxID=53431 RepID=UPI003636D964
MGISTYEGVDGVAVVTLSGPPLNLFAAVRGWADISSAERAERDTFQGSYRAGQALIGATPADFNASDMRTTASYSVDEGPHWMSIGDLILEGRWRR